MGVGSRVNPNFPIPGLDQSSKGFRDNFAIIKREIEGIQGTTIQLVGGVLSEPIELGNSGSMVINTAINGNIIGINTPNKSLLYNNSGFITGDDKLIYNDSTETVGIGTSNPNTFMKLDVYGKARFVESVNINQESSEGTSYLSLFTPTGNIAIINNGSSGQFGSVTATPIHLMTTSTNRVTVSPTGNVGIGTTLPVVALDVVGNRTQDVARFKNNVNLIDSVIRASTSQLNSTIGWAVENINANQLGGIRIDNVGTVTIHSGESTGAALSTSTARISIDNSGKVGIGSNVPSVVLDVNGTFKSRAITDISTSFTFAVGINNKTPEYELDVDGDISRTRALISKFPYIIIDTTSTIIDAWPMDVYRSAKYIIQVSRGSAPTEQVDAIEYMVIHANNIAIGQQVGYLSSGVTPLGTVSVTQAGGYVEVRYAGAATNNVVRLDKTYIIR